MAAFNSNIGTRATITLGTSSYESSFEVTAIRLGSMERAVIDASHMGLADPGATNPGNRKYIPGELISLPQVIVEGFFNPNLVPPFFGTPGTGSTAVEVLTVTFPGGSGATPCTWAGSAFLVSFEAGSPMEEMMTATLTWQFTGLITNIYATAAELVVTTAN